MKGCSQFTTMEKGVPNLSMKLIFSIVMNIDCTSFLMQNY